MSAGRIAPVRLVRGAGSDPDLALLDPYNTNVPDDEYELVFLSEERFHLYRREVWAVVLRIIEGPHSGLPVFFFLNIPPLRDRRTPSAKLSLAYAAATGQRAPARIARVRPSRFLKETVVLGQTRRPEKNIHGAAVPPEQRYSVVDCLVGGRASKRQKVGR